MPRGRKPGSRSTAIREMLEQNPKAKAKEVVELLVQKGVKVNTRQVYMVKGSMKQRKAQRRRKAAKVATVVGNSMAADPVALIRKVKELAHEAGGMHNLRELIKVLAE